MSVEMRTHPARELFLQSLTNLRTAIEVEQARLKARNESTLELLPEVESAALRFVRCGQAIAGFSDELTRRATYLVTATAAGTAYLQARTEFIRKIPRPSRRNQCLADTLKELKNVAYRHPHHTSDLKRCITKLAWVKNELSFDGPLNQALIDWHAAAGDILDQAQLWAVDGCRYLRMITGEERENPLERIESQLLDDILNAATRLADDILAVDSPNGSQPLHATAGAKRRGARPKRDDAQFRRVIDLHSKGNGPKAISRETNYPLKTVNRYLNRHRKRAARKRTADN